MVVQEQNLNKRISGTDINGTTRTGAFIADPIPVDLSETCPVIFKNFGSNMGANTSDMRYGNSKVALLDSEKECLAVWYMGTESLANTWGCPIVENDCVGDLSTILKTNPTAGTKPTVSDVAYVVFSPEISSSSITMADLSGLEIQMH